jgi:hypothetical protein
MGSTAHRTLSYTVTYREVGALANMTIEIKEDNVTKKKVESFPISRELMLQIYNTHKRCVELDIKNFDFKKDDYG